MIRTRNESDSGTSNSHTRVLRASSANMSPSSVQQQRANSSQQQRQLKTIAQMQAVRSGLLGRVLQARAISASAIVQRSAVVEERDNATDSLTADKKISTRNYGTGWYRFAKNGYQINSFSNNQTSLSPAGASPVLGAIELSNHPDLKYYDIGSISRARHFGAGDALAKISPSFRKGKWTWHHRISPYEMELVDMGVHKSFYHHGGFSAWQEGRDDDNDD